MKVRELRAPAQGAALEAAAAEAAERLAGGEILVHPTSTLYGLGAEATPEADAEIARLKGRSPGAPLIRLVADAETLLRARPSLRWDERAERLAREFWPGALTLVLDDGGEHGLAVRVDGHPVVRAILRAYGAPMSSTSVNRSGEPPAVEPAEVRRALARLPASDRPVTLLDAGPLPPSPPSTLLSLREERPRLLRAGAVEPARLAACLGEPLAGAEGGGG